MAKINSQPHTIDQENQYCKVRERTAVGVKGEACVKVISRRNLLEMRPSTYADDNLFLFECCLYQHAELSELTSRYIYSCPSVHRIYFNLKKLNLKKKEEML